MYYNGDQNGSNGTLTNEQIDIPDRNGLVSRDGGRGDTENEDTRPGQFLKRGSTQATGATDMKHRAGQTPLEMS